MTLKREPNAAAETASFQSRPECPHPSRCFESSACLQPVICDAAGPAPAVPGSETPREIFYLPRNGYAGNQPAVWLDDWRRMRRRAEEAERCESLAQTEIKGHMRIEDDLRRDLASEVAIVNRVWKALGIETYDAAKPFAIDEHVTLLKARIAELEKLLREAYGEFAKRHILATDLQARIDAALKSRA